MTLEKIDLGTWSGGWETDPNIAMRDAYVQYRKKLIEW
jgi:hypothetical protein